MATRKFGHSGDNLIQVLGRRGHKQWKTCRKYQIKKTQASTATINTIASNEILNKVESLVLLELHERITIPGLLNNAEAWVLNKTESDELERIEI